MELAVVAEHVLADGGASGSHHAAGCVCAVQELTVGANLDELPVVELLKKKDNEFIGMSDG